MKKCVGRFAVLNCSALLILNFEKIMVHFCVILTAKTICLHLDRPSIMYQSRRKSLLTVMTLSKAEQVK